MMKYRSLFAKLKGLPVGSNEYYSTLMELKEMEKSIKRKHIAISNYKIK